MFGEVVICQFPFTFGATSKIRPALVLFDLPQDAIICRITSGLGGGSRIAPATPPTPPGMRVRTGRFQSDLGNDPEPSPV
jgi:hypothetical protein